MQNSAASYRILPRSRLPLDAHSPISKSLGHISPSLSLNDSSNPFFAFLLPFLLPRESHNLGLESLKLLCICISNSSPFHNLFPCKQLQYAHSKITPVHHSSFYRRFLLYFLALVSLSSIVHHRGYRLFTVLPYLPF
jgi:hypothetical protein